MRLGLHQARSGGEVSLEQGQAASSSCTALSWPVLNLGLMCGAMLPAPCSLCFGIGLERLHLETVSET